MQEVGTGTARAADPTDHRGTPDRMSLCSAVKDGEGGGREGLLELQHLSSQLTTMCDKALLS